MPTLYGTSVKYAIMIDPDARRISAVVGSAELKQPRAISPPATHSATLSSDVARQMQSDFRNITLVPRNEPTSGVEYAHIVHEAFYDQIPILSDALKNGNVKVYTWLAGSYLEIFIIDVFSGALSSPDTVHLFRWHLEPTNKIKLE